MPDEAAVLLDEAAVVDDASVLGEAAVLGEAVFVLDEAPVLDEPPPHAATSSTMPAVTARTPARRLPWE